jgi:hypothetical protein
MTSGRADTGAYFAALLSRIALTHGSITAFRMLALANVNRFREVWVAVRAALQDAGREGGERTQALWYVVDGILKDAPAVYGSYVGRELPQLARRFLPFHEPWAAPLLESWVVLLPDTSAIAAVASDAAAEYAQVQLQAELAAATARVGADATAAEPATGDDLQDLQSMAQRIVEAVGKRRKNVHSVRVKLESVKAEPGLVKEERAALARTAGLLRDLGNTRETAMDADEDYAPSYVSGAKMGRLRRESDDLAVNAPPGPSGDTAGASGTKRERRVRPRAA